MYVNGRSVETDDLILKYHYSKRLPTSVRRVFSIFNGKDFIATAYFSNSTAPWKEEVLELSRLVRKEEESPKPKMTGLISYSLKQLKRDKEFNLIVAYACNANGHFGGVYQASSWNFHEMRKPKIEGFAIDGVFVPRRTLNNVYKTSSLKKLREMFPEKKITPHYDKGKFLYWKALNKEGYEKAIRLSLKCNPYPKPHKQRGGKDK